MAFLDIDHLQKSFGAMRVVKDFSLGIEKGEFVSFLGPSGCGKTTILRMVAGFETPSGGVISMPLPPPPPKENRRPLLSGFGWLISHPLPIMHFSPCSSRAGV